MAEETRYYAYGPNLGRMRAPTEFNEEEVIVWAKGRGAHNVVREHGPVSKPTALTLVWQNSEPTTYQKRAGLWDILAERFPYATAAEIQPVVDAIEKYIQEAYTP